MAPELRTRKPKESSDSAAKSSSKSKTAGLPGKRKATEESSPVATKKSKSAKQDKRPKQISAPKPTRREKTTKAVVREESQSEDSSDNEDAVTQALANAVDSDDEDGNVGSGPEPFKPGQDVGKAPKPVQTTSEASEATGNSSGILYVGRIPHGFYEHEMRAYFGQFGEVVKCRISRNKKTAASKHFAFIQFAEPGVAEIVAKTMDGYLMFGHILKVKMVPASQIHENLWKGSTNKRFKKVPWNKMAGNRLKKPLPESIWTSKIEKEEEKRRQRAKKLEAIGYDFEAPTLKVIEDAQREPAAVEDTDDKMPKAIEEAVEATVAKADEEENGDDTQGENAEATSKKTAKAKVSKKSKKSTKTKKV
ncbi:RNA-binding domain-containing protein [Xylariomycetidae sp. FL2044]|nr:RNA-binding domain-containing protein [Xylariomycetidae sp. FL2044]